MIFNGSGRFLLCTFAAAAFLTIFSHSELFAVQFIWEGGNGFLWEDPSNWKTKGERRYPYADTDTAVFDSSAKGGCKLSRDVQIRSLEMRSGFRFSLELDYVSLGLSGNADFSYGTLIAENANLFFYSDSALPQVYKPHPKALFDTITILGTGEVRVMERPVMTGILSLQSGTWRFSNGPNVVSRGLIGAEGARLVFDRKSLLVLDSGNADLRSLGDIVTTGEDTLRFAAKTGTQKLFSRSDLSLPVIDKNDSGTVVVEGEGFSSGALIVSRGTWIWANSGDDTVHALKMSDEAKMVFDASGLNIRSGEVAFLGVGSVNDLTLPRRVSVAAGVKDGAENINPDTALQTARIVWLPDTAVLRPSMAAFEAGVNFYFGSNPMITNDTVGNVGLALGILMPIRVPHIIMLAHIKLLVHGDRARLEPDRNYITANNALLFGKAAKVRGFPFEVTPLLGFGFANGIVMSNFLGSGQKGHQLHYFGYYSIGVMARRMFTLKGVSFCEGLKLSFDCGFRLIEDTRVRLGLSTVTGF